MRGGQVGSREGEEAKNRDKSKTSQAGQRKLAQEQRASEVTQNSAAVPQRDGGVALGTEKGD